MIPDRVRPQLGTEGAMVRNAPLLVVVLAGLTVAACATTTPSPRARANFARPHHEADRVRMAVLPVENDAYPKIAKAINEVFRMVRLRAVDDYFRSKVTLEVAQLSIECVDP